MTSPTMRHIVPKEILPALKALGKHDWLEWRPKNTDPPSTELEVKIPDDPAIAEHEAFLFKLQFDWNWKGFDLLRLYAYSKTLALGPKLLRPTVEQCEALQHVDVNVTLQEYQQPFPSFVVEFPEEFRRKLTQEFRHDCPRFVLNYHDEKTHYVLTYCVHDSKRGSTGNIISPRKQFKTIEDALRFMTDDDGPDLQQGEVLQRIACNFGLMLTNFGAKSAGPLDPASHSRNQSQAKSRRPHKARRAQAMLDAAFTEIGFEQDVVFYDTHSASNDPSEPTGRVVKTHWRRGHFRRQRHGKGLNQTKLVFIRPCLVNAELFKGDLADTEYRISIKEVKGDASSPAAESQVSRIGG